MNFVQLGRTGTFNSKSFTNIVFLNKHLKRMKGQLSPGLQLMVLRREVIGLR